MSRPLRIIEVVPSVEDEASGLTAVVPRLSRALSDEGHDVELMSVGEPSRTASGRLRDTRHAQDWEWAPCDRLRCSSALRRGLREAGRTADLIHAHSLWQMPNVYPAAAARRWRKPFILSPHGTLGAPALRISRLRKLAFWSALQGRAVRSASCLHATCEEEYREIRALGLRQPVAVIPNAVDVPAAAGARRHGPRTLLYLGRIHPKKGLDRLLLAWNLVEGRHPDWRLRIVGPGPADHVEALRRLAAGLARAAIEAPLYGDDKRAALSGADLFVLPTLNDNFAMAVAEALASATPAIVTKGAPWSGLVATESGWWIDHGVEALAHCLDDAMGRDQQQLAEMGLRGRDWMRRDFGWNRVAAEMSAVYRWAADGGEPPDCVRLD